MAKSKSAVRTVSPTTRAIPLALAPLLKPYKKHGRLSLRVERMQRFSRLSRGHNNGDGTWSLATDELEDLDYLCPENSDLNHVLSVRIVGLDHGDTLAVLDVPVDPEVRATNDDGAKPFGTKQTSARDLEVHTGREPDESDSLKTSLAARDVELADMRESIKQAEADLPEKIESAVAAARDGWKMELEQHLNTAALHTSKAVEDARKAWLTDQSALLTQSKDRAELRLSEARERWRRESKDTIAQAETAWKEAETSRLAKAHELWRESAEKSAAELKARCERAEATLARHDAELAQARKAAKDTLERQLRDVKDSLTQAETAWKQGEVARLAKAQDEWRAESKKLETELQARCDRAEIALAEARAEAGTARKIARDEEEHKRVIEESARAQKALAERDAELAALRQKIHEVEADASRKIVAAVGEVRAGSKRELDAKLAEATARAKAELEENRNAWLAESKVLAEEHLAQARESWLREADETLAKARSHWQAEESSRLARARAAWREESERIASELKGRYERAELALAAALSAGTAAERDDAERNRLVKELEQTRAALADARATATDTVDRDEDHVRLLKEVVDLRTALDVARATATAKKPERDDEERSLLLEELTESRAALAGREAEIQQLRANAGEAVNRAQREAETSIEKAKAEWVDSELSRLASAEEQWRKHSAEALALATARCERAEAALAQARYEAQRGPGRDDGAVARLHDQIANLEATLANRERELAHARLAMGTSPQSQQARIHLRRDRGFDAAESEVRQERRKAAGRLSRDILVVGLVAVIAVLAWPRIEAAMPDSWREALGLESDQDYVDDTAAAPQKPALPVAAPVPQPQQNLATLIHGANVRADHATDADVVTTLERGATVVVLAEHGNWTEVRAAAEPGKQAKEGWVYSSFLKALPAPAQAPPAAKDTSGAH